MKLIAASLSFLFLSFSFSAMAEIKVTDISGRQIILDKPAKHIVLGEGRFLPTIAILDGEKVFERVVGMSADFKKYDPATYMQYAKLYPAIDDIPILGSGAGATFSVEQAFKVKPDLAIFGLSSGHGPNDKSKAIMDKFDAAGIAVVIVDFRMEPVKNTPKSIEILGQLLGREKEASEFLEFYNQKMAGVTDRLKNLKEKPSVFIETHVGMRPGCCSAFGHAMMGRLVTLAGGINAYGDIIPGAAGMVNVEHLIANQPDIYVGTAIGSAVSKNNSPNYITLGAGTEEKKARQSLVNSTDRLGIKQLKAIKDGRGYAIWHHFYNTPMHVAATEMMAKWFHPELFTDLSPEKSLEEFFVRFQPVPLGGSYWVSLKEDE